MKYKTKSIISFIIMLTVIGFGQYYQVYDTSFSTVMTLTLVITWISFMYHTFRFIFNWYREDLLKRTETELERIENLDEDEKDEDKGWIPKLF